MERDPELEQSLEDFTFKGAGEGERYESPHEGERFVARLSHGDELGSFLLLAGVQSSVTLHLREGKRGAASKLKLYSNKLRNRWRQTSHR